MMTTLSLDVLDDMSNLSTTDREKTTPSKEEDDKNKQSEESLDDLLDQEEFAKQLAAGMEELMGRINQDQEMKDTFEKIWKSFEEAESSTTSNSREGAGPSRPNQSFQETIAQTMNKLKDSSKQVDVSKKKRGHYRHAATKMEGYQSSIAEEGQMDDAFMAEMMRQMESLAENGEFENVLEGMMQQLMSKELLYEPMKDMAERVKFWWEEWEFIVRVIDWQLIHEVSRVAQEE